MYFTNWGIPVGSPMLGISGFNFLSGLGTFIHRTSVKDDF